MDAIDREALTGLTTALRALLPPGADPVQAPRLTVDPVRIGAAGVGGLVGLSRDPVGEIHGRRLEATARVRVGTTDAARLDDAVSAVTGAIVTGDRALLRSQGLLDARLAGVGPEASVAEDGGTSRFERDVSFALLYEHLRRPEAAAGTIQDIPVSVTTEHAAAAASLLSLDRFEVFDDPRASRRKPSRWLVAADGARIEQASGIWGGVAGLSAHKPGTYLVLRTDPLADFRLEVRMGAADPHAIGLVFRWQGLDEYGFFLMQQDRDFRLLGKKVGGSFSGFGPAAVTEGASFTLGATHLVALTLEGRRVSVTVDGAPALVGEDPALPATGRIGFLCHRNPAASFAIGDLRAL